MEDKQLILNMVLYCSDHANPTKTSMLYFRWMTVEMEEYYQQGDLERKLDFSVSPFFDRATCNPFKFQLGYIDVIANPLFETWCEFKPDFRDTLIVDGLEPNRRLLTQKIDETKSISDQNSSNQPQTKLSEHSKDDGEYTSKDGGSPRKDTLGKAGKNSGGELNSATVTEGS